MSVAFSRNREAEREGTALGSLWVDRLAEVWASPGYAGAGVVVGADAVLTARHVVADALGDSAARLLARVVRPGCSVAGWAPMQSVWDDEGWDLALLSLDGASPDARAWEGPQSSASRIVVVDLGTMAAPDCEAVGFPESAIQHARNEVQLRRSAKQSRRSGRYCRPVKASPR
jgi:Trypsin-like peptidase domain